MACWRLPRPILRPGLGNALKSPSGGFLGPFCGLGLEMLQNGLLEASWAHSAAWAWKCCKMGFWGLPGLSLRPGLGNAENKLLGASCAILRPGLGKSSTRAFWGFLGPFCGLGLEMLYNNLLGASWAHSAAWAWKCFKMAFWGLLGPILRPGFGNAAKWLPGGFLGPFCGLGLEMLQNGFLGTSGPFCGLGLEMLQNGLVEAS